MTFKLTLSAFGYNNWAKQLEDREKENEALGTQVEMLKAHLQGAEQHIACKEEKVGELSTRLESETKENKFLWKQVEQLTNNLQKERSVSLELTEQLQQQKGALQQELEAEKRSHAERVRVDQELIQRLRDEQDALRQELETLETKLGDLTSTNLKLATKLKTEEVVSQALQREFSQLNKELKEQEEEFLPEPEVFEEKLPEKKKRRSVWKRVRHFLGLRKKNERREKESTSN
ncbi:trichohyalin-like [Siniperca chuatsi]|uniref:trichohyalin-like n=1 Tax=Siniperca chuatsi TaxID=119488 RepID=UPI001CE16931|nr:trichohyalin-like isoform X2 [Siniperca chuatsi]XP_044033092.1 trichohyalin-like [Siniperca chuatsi]